MQRLQFPGVERAFIEQHVLRVINAKVQGFRLFVVSAPDGGLQREVFLYQTYWRASHCA